MANRRAFQYPRYQAWGSDETFLDGGTIEFFDAGTSNNRNIYQDAALTTTAPNPITLNSRGEPQSSGGTAIDIYLDEQPYKIVLKDSSGTTIHTIDNYIETQDVLEPKDPADATDQATDVFEGQLNSDPASGETFQVDFQDANTTTTPTFENTSGSLGALTIKTRDGSALWGGALNGVHELQYDGTDYLVTDPYYGSQDLDTDSTPTFSELTVNGQLLQDPEHATDGGTDAYDSATNTTVPSDGETLSRDFQSANTTTTPTLDSKTITDRDGNALWAGAINGVHELQYASGTDTYLLLDPRPTEQNIAWSPVSRNTAARFKAGDPSAAQDVATKAYTDSGDLTPDTEVDATNGGSNDLTEIDFTGIKAGANRIEIPLNDLSLSAGDDLLIQIGDSGGVETSAYSSISGQFTGSSTTVESSTAGFIVRVGVSGDVCSGRMVITRVGGNKWVSSHGARRATTVSTTGAGEKELSAELDRVRITSNGSSTFDNGTVNILVE